MPLYPYSCGSCGHHWEALVSSDDRDKQVCPKCEEASTRDKVTGFAVSSELDPKTQTVYSKKEIDKVVGVESERKWVDHQERIRKRREGKDYTIVDLDIKPGTKFNPQEHLGTDKQKDLARVNVEAFREHQRAKSSQ